MAKKRKKKYLHDVDAKDVNNLTQIGKEILLNSIQKRIDRNTILLIPKDKAL